MRSRINSTGRRKIERGLTAFTVTELADGTAEFQARIDLAPLNLPADGQVVVEAYRQSIHERFPFGTTGRIAPGEPTVLRELGKNNILFRVKVVEPESGCLLASADRLAPAHEVEAGRRELLKVIFCELGQELWKTALHEDQPVLMVNRNIPDAKAKIRSDPFFQAMILPAALRQIMLMLWIEKADDEEEDEDGHWTTSWIRYAQQISGREKPDWSQDNEVSDWIDDVCQAFSNQFGILNKLNKTIGET
jgi:hypothetical protein